MAISKAKRSRIKNKMLNCWYCGVENPTTIDHVVPLFEGGNDDLSNLVMACKKCNSSKRALSLEQFRFQCSWNKTKYSNIIKFGTAIQLIRTGVSFDGFVNNHKFWFEGGIK